MKEFSPFRLDVENQCLWREDKRVVLTPKAFAVLCYLVDRAGRLVSQSEILDSLWPDTFVQPEVLKTHILDVRTALGDSAKNPSFIETMPRRGYRFIANVTETMPARQFLVEQKGLSNFVGRAQELALLEGFLEKAKGGERQVVFVAGEIGVGKTTFVDKFVQQVASKNPEIRTIRGQCVEGHGTQEPYYPVLEALGCLLRGPDSESLVELLLARAPTLLAQFPSLLKSEHREILRNEIMGATKERMIREICEALEAITTNKTLVIILEDVHWVDSSTVDLLEVLANRRIREQLMVVATYRPVHIALVQHPLKAAKQRLLVHNLCQEVVINTFTEPEVEEYLAAKSEHGFLPDGLTGLIYRHSDGNPLFLVSVLDHLKERGFLSDSNHLWQLNVPLAEIDMEVPASLRRMLEMHIDRRLTTEEKLALEAGSVSGVLFLADVGAHAAEMSRDNFENICETFADRVQIIRSAGLISLPDGTVTPRYEFVHAFYREVLYRRIAPGRRARMHRQTAEQLELRFAQRQSEVAAELAWHFEESFDWARAVQYLQLVADNEAKRFAYYEAVPVLQHALELVKKLPEPEDVTGEIRLLGKLGALYFAVEDIERSTQTFEMMAQRAREAHNPSSEMCALVQLVFPLSRLSADESLKVIRRALELSEDETDFGLKAHIRMTCFFLRILVGRWSEEDARNHRIETEQMPSDMPLNFLAERGWERAALQWASSEYKEGLQNIEASIPLMVEAGNIGHRAAQLEFTYVLLFYGKWGRALKLLEGFVATAMKNGNYVRAGILQISEAWVRLNAMDYAGVLEICEAVIPTVADRAQATFLRQALVIKGAAECGLGFYERAQEHLLWVRDAMDDHALLMDWYWRLLLQSALTELASKRGDLVQARNEGELFLKLSLATAERTWQALAWEQNARIEIAEAKSSRAQDTITKALFLVENSDLPLAAYRVYLTAAQVFPERAEHYRQLCTDNVRKLAESLEEFPLLQKTFLTSELARSFALAERVAS